MKKKQETMSVYETPKRKPMKVAKLQVTVAPEIASTICCGNDLGATRNPQLSLKTDLNQTYTYLL